MIRIYGDIQSGNCYKLKLICGLLDIEHEWIAVDIMKGETRSPEFLALNPNGQIPVMISGAGEVLTQSNAILYFLGRDSDFWSTDHLEQTRILEWQFFEQYSHEPSIAVARFIMLYQGMPESRLDEYHSKVKAGHRALSIMEQRLGDHHFIATNHCSLADISLFAYTHVAHQGGFDLSAYPAVTQWIKRIEGLEGFTPMQG